jgi:hypothetical protein
VWKKGKCFYSERATLRLSRRECRVRSVVRRHCGSPSNHGRTSRFYKSYVIDVNVHHRLPPYSFFSM